jgi:hypothetical protein
MFGSLEQDCSDYILDLLEYIKNDLLRVDKANRAMIEDIVAKFEKLNDECQRDASYCILRTSNRPARRTNSELSEIVEVPSSPGKELAPDSPLVPATIWPLHRSTSITSQYEISRGKKRPNSINRVIETNQTHSRSPLATNILIAHSNLSHDLEDLSTQSGESVESTSTLWRIDQRSLQVTDGVKESEIMQSDLEPPFLQANQQRQIRIDVPGDCTDPHTHPEAHSLNVEEYVPDTNDSKLVSPTLEIPTEPSIDKLNSSPQTHRLCLKDTKTERPRPSSVLHGEHTRTDTEPRKPRAKWRQLKQHTYGRATKFLNWCLRENRS